MGVPQGSTPPRAPTPWVRSPATPCSARRPARLVRAPPPTDPGAPMWGGCRRRRRVPPAPTTSATGSSPARRPSRSRAGVAIGHATWTGNTPASRRPLVGQLPAPVAGSDRAFGQPLRKRLPVRWHLRELGQLGQSATPATATRARRADRPERRRRHRGQGGPRAGRHQHDARLPAGAGGRDRHRAHVQRRDPDQQPRDRRRHHHQRHRRRATARPTRPAWSATTAPRTSPCCSCTTPRACRPRPLGHSSNVSVGEDVVGVGNAGGTGGTPSAAGGTVTALNQSITASDEGDGNVRAAERADRDQRRHSARRLGRPAGQHLRPGDRHRHGGLGRLLLPVQRPVRGNQGFAIPINTALSIARQIEAGNALVHRPHRATAFLGVEISPARIELGLGLWQRLRGLRGRLAGTRATPARAALTSGATVAGIVTNGPAQEAGLAQGDVITSLGGKTITSANDLTNAMGIYHPGDKVSIALDRHQRADAHRHRAAVLGAAPVRTPRHLDCWPTADPVRRWAGRDVDLVRC